MTTRLAGHAALTAALAVLALDLHLLWLPLTITHDSSVCVMSSDLVPLCPLCLSH